ncbi:hypothetical protein QML10_27435 [Klebsiella pneumoniae]
MSTDTATGTTGPGAFSLGDWYVVHTYAGHSRLETTETYTRVFALDVGRQYGVRFSLPDSHLTLPE